MAAPIVRPLSLRFSLPEDLRVSSEVVLKAILDVPHLEDLDVRCLTQTRQGRYQLTMSTSLAKERMMVEGLDIEGRHIEVSSVQPNTALVTIKMPCEMADEHVTSHLSKYANVVSVRRLTYRNFPSIETGVRAFKLSNVRPTAQLPNVITVGPYHMVVRVSGQYVRRCFRCGSNSHLVRDCPSPPPAHRSATNIPDGTDVPSVDVADQAGVGHGWNTMETSAPEQPTTDTAVAVPTDISDSPVTETSHAGDTVPIVGRDVDVIPPDAELVSATSSSVDLTVGIPPSTDSDHSATAGIISDTATDRVGDSVTVVPLFECEDGTDKPNSETSLNTESSHSVLSADDRPSDSIPVGDRRVISLDHSYDVSSSRPLFVVPSVVPSASPPLPQRGRTIVRKSLKQQTPTRKSRRARSSSSESSQRERTPPRSRTPSDRSRKQTPVSEACRSGTPPMADGRPVLPYVRAGVTHLRVLRIDSPFYDQQDASESPTPASMQ